MKRVVSRLIISLGLLSSVAYAQSEPQAVAGEYLIKFKASSGGASLAQTKLYGKASLKAAVSGLGILQISLKAGADATATYESLRNDPDVEYIEPNYILSKMDGAGDSEVLSYEQVVASGMIQGNSNVYSQSSDTSGVASAWAVQTPLEDSSAKIIVAVVDTGLDASHRVFQPYTGNEYGGTGGLWINQRELNGIAGVDDDRNGYVDDINGWNFIRNTSNFADDDGHGTHVAGIVIGTGQNIFARPLQESKVLVMPLKFLGAGGTGSTSDAISAIYYAVNNGARVINNSWGGAGYSKALHDAITYAYSNGVLVVSAAGNFARNNDSTPMYPANYNVPSNISVASINSYDYSLSNFSNYGASTVHIGAPGESITSTYPGGGTRSMSGTSMAAPFVAGMAALSLREAPTLTGYQIKQVIFQTATQVNDLYGKVSTGARISALQMVQSSQNLVGTASAQPTYVPSYSRDLASEEPGGAGCGLVSTALMQGPGAGASGGTSAALVFGLLMIPLIMWQVLRARDPKNKRRYERFKMESQIRVSVGDRELVGAVRTISEGGLSFSADEALEKGGIVTMRIQSPDGHETIEVQGQVVWSEANQAYGVQFENARQGTLAMIRDWTNGLIKT